MAFQDEEALRDALVANLGSSLGFTSATVRNEFPFEGGRADVVLFNISDTYLKHRLENLELKKAILKKHTLQNFLQVHSRGEVSTDYFFELGGHKKSTKSNALSWLKKYGYLSETDNGRLRSPSNFRRHVTTALAVEVKISKWKDALKQAFSYKSFSHYQFVALDSDHIRRSLDNVDLFEHFGVGLLGVDISGLVNIHYLPSRTSPYSPYNTWLLNEWALSTLT